MLLDQNEARNVLPVGNGAASISVCSPGLTLDMFGNLIRFSASQKPAPRTRTMPAFGRVVLVSNSISLGDVLDRILFTGVDLRGKRGQDKRGHAGFNAVSICITGS